MSTTQSQMHPSSQAGFNFNPTATLTQMNLRQDGIRQSGAPPLTQGAINGQQHFMPNRQQQPELSQSPMGMLPSNNVTSNLPMNMLGGGQPGNPTIANQQQMQRQRQANLLHQAQTAQNMNPPGASGQSMAGLGNNQMGAMAFQNMLQQNPMNTQQLRRVQSQPQSLNQPPMQHMQMPGGGVHGQQGGIPMPMGMNAANSMPAQMRQQMSLRPPAPADLAGRQHGNPAMAQDIQQRRDSQIMSSLSQQPGLSQQPHSTGMPQSLPSNGFPAPIGHTQHTMSPSPRLVPGSQPQTPANMNMASPAQGQPGMRNSQGDLFPFSGQPFPQSVPGNARGVANPPFPFVPSSSPPNHGDMPLMGTPINSRPSGFQMTPAQQLQNGSEGFGHHFSGMPPPTNNGPPRPPSNLSGTPTPQHQPIHLASPGDHMSPQRPQSQPHGPPGRPPSQSGLSVTPRSNQVQLPPAAGRAPPLTQAPPGLHQPQSASGHPLPIAPRPPQPVVPIAGPSALPVAPLMAADGQPGGPARTPNTSTSYPLGLGQGLTRLLQFSGVLASENKQRLSLAHWDLLIKEYFANNAVMKFTLWKDNQRNEAKPFDIGVPILPRFFLVTAQSGVKSMSLSLDGARERLLSQNRAVIECVTAAWTYKYTNGYTVTLRGPLTAHIILVPNTARNQPGVQASSAPFTLKFDSLDFGANFHDKSISLESILGMRNPESSPPKTPHQRSAPTPNSIAGSSSLDEDKKWEEPRVTIDHAYIPGEPVNAFGIPQATMRCLELAESVGTMTDLIAFADEQGTGPIEGLVMYAAKLRADGAVAGTLNGAPNSGGFQNFQTLNGVNPTPAVTLYSGVPPPTGPPAPPPQAPSTPQNPPSATNSPRKQNKTVAQPANAATPGASTSGSTPLASASTPSMSNSTLKRKQGDAASPITEPPPSSKRATRQKRGRGAVG